MLHFISITHQIEFINGFNASTSLAVVDWQLITYVKISNDNGSQLLGIKADVSWHSSVNKRK